MSRPTPDTAKGFDGLRQQTAGKNNMTGLQADQLNPTLEGICSCWDDGNPERPEWVPPNTMWAYTKQGSDPVTHFFLYNGQTDVPLWTVSRSGFLALQSVKDASTTQTGISRLATIPETANANLNNLAVTPQGLNNLKASETVIGLAEKATNTEVLTGTDDVRFVSPKGLQSLTATTGRKGIVQLSNAVNSTSETFAATLKAVKAAYDLANTANTRAIPAVVNSWTDASTTKAGAVGLAKWLYDNKANKTDAVPKPTSTNWVIIEGPAASRFLPSGGTWAYFALKINSPNGIGVTCTQSAGVAPGGSRVGAGTDTGAAFGFAWKIA